MTGLFFYISVSVGILGLQLTKKTLNKYNQHISILDRQPCKSFVKHTKKITHHVNSNLSNVGFAMLLFKVLDPGLFFGDKVCENILQVL